MNSESPLSVVLRAAVRAIKNDVPKDKYQALQDAADQACGVLDRQYARVSKMQAASIAGGNVGRKALNFDVEHAKRLREEGKTWQAISEELGVSVASLRRRLS